jgi:hypothetical protein
MLFGYQSSNYSSLPPPRLYFKPCEYRNVNYFLTVANHFYRKRTISMKILISLSLWKVTFKGKTLKLSHQIWRQSGKIFCLYSEVYGFNSQPGDRMPWLKCSGIFLSSLQNVLVTVQISLLQPPFITCLCRIHYLNTIRSTLFCIHMMTMNTCRKYTI